MKRCFILGFVIILLSGIIFADEDSVLPRYELKKGSSFQYQLSVETDLTQNNPEQPIHRYEKWEIKCKMKVTERMKEDGYPLTVSYTRLGYELKTPFEDYQNNNLNSSNPDLPGNLLPYAKLVGTNFQMILTNRLTVIPPTNTSRRTSNPTSFPLLNLGSENIIVNQIFPSMMNNIFLAYPEAEESMQVNDSWQQNIFFSNGALMPVAKVQYLISSIVKKSFSIQIQSQDCSLQKESIFTSKTNDKEEMSEKLTADLAGSMEGNYEVDRKNGLPLTGNVVMNFTGETNRLGMTIPVQMKLIIHFEKK